MGVSALQSGVKGLDSTSGPAAYSQLTGFKGQSVSGRPGLSPIESLFWGVKLSQTEILKKDVGGNRRQPQIYSAGMKDPERRAAHQDQICCLQIFLATLWGWDYALCDST